MRWHPPGGWAWVPLSACPSAPFTPTRSCLTLGTPQAGWLVTADIYFSRFWGLGCPRWRRWELWCLVRDPDVIRDLRLARKGKAAVCRLMKGSKPTCEDSTLVSWSSPKAPTSYLQPTESQDSTHRFQGTTVICLRYQAVTVPLAWGAICEPPGAPSFPEHLHQSPDTKEEE